MWFYLSAFATLMMVLRRTTEKRIVHGIDSLALTWLQQAFALPFIIVFAVMSLFFTKFYLPTDLGVDFWGMMTIYVVLGAVDLYCYFKALSLADISLVAPFLTLAAAGNILGAYVILGQKPSTSGLIGAALIMCGAYIIHKNKRSSTKTKKSNKKALWFVLLLVFVRSIGSNIEVPLVRATNPISFNFYSSLLTVLFVVGLSYLMRPKRNPKHEHYWRDVKKSVLLNKAPLLLIGFTYMVNLTMTYQAKIMAPNAGYVGAVKASNVLPMVLIGVLFFKEKFEKLQWVGLLLVLSGLLALATN